MPSFLIDDIQKPNMLELQHIKGVKVKMVNCYNCLNGIKIEVLKVL